MTKQNGPETTADAKPATSFPESFNECTALTVEQASLINSIRKNNHTPKIEPRVGPISVHELLEQSKAENADVFAQYPMMKKLNLAKPVTREAILNAALEHIPLVPGFPNPQNAVHPNDSSPNTIFRPEIFKTTIEAVANASAQHGTDVTNVLHSFKGVFPREEIVKPSVNSRPMHSVQPDLRPWFPDHRKGPTAQINGHRSAHNSVHRPSPPNHCFPSPSATNMHGMQPNVAQKTRKPFFMPYMCSEAVERGLKDPSSNLFQGVLRVNQRNYEESYIDNPEGDSETDILILGVHDRNRALHGDLVVVKIKDRDQWVISEAAYQSWKRSKTASLNDPNSSGSSNVSDLKSSQTFIVAGVSLSLSDLSIAVPLNEKLTYSRTDLIRIGAQMELGTSGQTGLMPAVEKFIENLGIARREGDVAMNPLRRFAGPPPQRKTLGGVVSGPTRRASVRMVGELFDDPKAIPDMCLQKTAEVVYISQTKNCRTAMGQLKTMADGNRNWALFSPTDSRMPRMMIPADELPADFFDRPQDYQKYLFVAKMFDWAATAQFARGRLERQLGLAGDIAAETEGVLFSNAIDTREFSPAALSSLPITESTQWKIDDKELMYRMDLRNEIIFTIDPAAARDLDDALHIKTCDDIDGKGTKGYEVGVHVADVTHFLIEDSELDRWAQQRATSTYLVHKVIPMLPRILCEELCSLKPNADRLAFSVIWRLNENADICHEQFARSIIRSKCKLSYEHAQDFINNPAGELRPDSLPELYDGVTPDVLREKVLQLMGVAKRLHAKRETDGSLRIDQRKLSFRLDPVSGLPIGIGTYIHRDSNRLVEEYMILANMRVALKIEHAFPKLAVLRRHPPPKQKILRDVIEHCAQIGFPIDSASSGAIASSLRAFEGKTEIRDAISQVLSMMLSKPMQLARYICAGCTKTPAEYSHYALALPMYTHFTSPIRRYADVLVHRLLSAACGYTPSPKLSDPEQINAICTNCNDRRAAAKTVSATSVDTFFGLFVKQCGPLYERGVVVAVLDASFDVLIIRYGVVKRVYVNRLDLAHDPLYVEGPPPSLTLFWKDKTGFIVEQIIKSCAVVDVILSALPELTKYQATIKAAPSSETQTLADLFAANVEFLGPQDTALDEDVADMRVEAFYADLDD